MAAAAMQQSGRLLDPAKPDLVEIAER